MSVFLLIVSLASLWVLAAVLRAALELRVSAPPTCASCGAEHCAGAWPLPSLSAPPPAGPAARPLLRCSPSPGSPAPLPPPTSRGVWQGYYGLRAQR